MSMLEGRSRRVWETAWSVSLAKQGHLGSARDRLKKKCGITLKDMQHCFWRPQVRAQESTRAHTHICHTQIKRERERERTSRRCMTKEETICNLSLKDAPRTLTWSSGNTVDMSQNHCHIVSSIWISRLLQNQMQTSTHWLINSIWRENVAHRLSWELKFPQHTMKIRKGPPLLLN